MPRATNGPAQTRKRKRILKRASGFRAGPGTLYRQALLKECSRGGKVSFSIQQVS